jgi:hypothetical protein
MSLVLSDLLATYLYVCEMNEEPTWKAKLQNVHSTFVYHSVLCAD